MIIYIDNFDILRNLKAAINWRIANGNKYLAALKLEQELYSEYLSKSIRKAA